MTAVLALALLGGLAILAIAVNHMSARLDLVEVTLNEGLPPGHQPHQASAAATIDVDAVRELLGPGIHVFLSRSCHACMRLIAELDHYPFQTSASMHIRYLDRPRPVATSAAQRLGASLHSEQNELIAHVIADPLPYTIAVGHARSYARGVTPTRNDVTTVANDAGIHVEQQKRLPEVTS